MSRLILLDSGPLGLVTNPRATEQSRLCNAWLSGVLAGGSDVLVPEIADYEVRRELIRAGRTKGLARLDDLAERIGYLPITTVVWRRAAEFWAQARAAGRPTASNAALDADMLLASQAVIAAEEGHEVVVATTNVGHLGQFVNARLWSDIT
jgi:predicted nucleic acid-binding protein